MNYMAKGHDSNGSRIPISIVTALVVLLTGLPLGGQQNAFAGRGTPPRGLDQRLASEKGTATLDGQETPPQEEQGGLKKQLGQIIVTPGNGPNLAVADFVARSAGVEAGVSTFNQVL